MSTLDLMADFILGFVMGFAGTAVAIILLVLFLIWRKIL